MKKLLASLLLVANVAQANWLPSFNAVRAWVPSWNSTKEAASSLASLVSENKVAAATIGGAAIVTTAIAVATAKHNKKPSVTQIVHVGSKDQPTAATSNGCASSSSSNEQAKISWADLINSCPKSIEAANSMTLKQLKDFVAAYNIAIKQDKTSEVVANDSLQQNKITIKQLQTTIQEKESSTLFSRAWQNTKNASCWIGRKTKDVVTSRPVRYGAAVA